MSGGWWGVVVRTVVGLEVRELGKDACFPKFINFPKSLGKKLMH